MSTALFTDSPTFVELSGVRFLWRRTVLRPQGEHSQRYVIYECGRCYESVEATAAELERTLEAHAQRCYCEPHDGD